MPSSSATQAGSPSRSTTSCARAVGHRPRSLPDVQARGDARWRAERREGAGRGLIINASRPMSSVARGTRLIAGALLLAPAIWFTNQTIDGLASRRALRFELAEIGHVRYSMLNADRWRDILVPIVQARIESLDVTPSDRANLRPTVVKALNHLLDDVQQKMSAPAAPAGAKPAQGGAGTSPGGGTPGSKPASVTASPGAASPASGAGTSPGASTSSGGASGPTPTSGAKASPPTAPGAKPAPAASPGGLFGGFLGGGGGGNAMIANMVVGALRPHIPEYADVVLAELLKPENKRAI